MTTYMTENSPVIGITFERYENDKIILKTSEGHLFAVAVPNNPSVEDKAVAEAIEQAIIMQNYIGDNQSSHRNGELFFYRDTLQTLITYIRSRQQTSGEDVRDSTLPTVPKGFGHDCDSSPKGRCEYDEQNDPLCDSCVYCGEPYERK